MIERAMVAFQRYFLVAIILVLLWGCGGSGGEGQGSKFIEDTNDLTTPELVDAYQQDNFRYGSSGDGYGCGGIDIARSALVCPASYIYRTKRGNCGAFTTFAIYCLRQAGFEAYSLKVFSQWPDDFAPGAYPRNYHYIVLYRDQGQWYIMDNGRGNGVHRGIDGPFADINDIPYTIQDIEEYDDWP